MFEHLMTSPNHTASTSGLKSKRSVMHKAALTVALSLSLAISACATRHNNPNTHPQVNANGQLQNGVNSTVSADKGYSQSELVRAVSTHLGVTSESAASAIERLFRDQGRPVGYITGEEGGGAFTIGARYGQGTLWLKDGRQQKIYWQGPTIGFDAGAEASKVFTLVYALNDPKDIFRRFPGAEGSAYLVAGMAVNYQRAHGITLAPIRTGVGVRLGVNVGYTSYTRKRSLLPL